MDTKELNRALLTMGASKKDVILGWEAACRTCEPELERNRSLINWICAHFPDILRDAETAVSKAGVAEANSLSDRYLSDVLPEVVLGGESYISKRQYISELARAKNENSSSAGS